MPRKKLVPDGPARGSMASLVARMAANGIQAVSGEDYSKTWRFLTFADPKTGLPSIAHEWLIGASGFRAGTVNQFRGLAAAGKSSLCMLEYASAYRNEKAFCAHLETEGGGMSNTRIAEFGLRPADLVIPDDVYSFEDAVAFVDTFRCIIRGGDGGSINELGRKSATKFKAEDAEDPECTRPILIGIDSLSNLGKDDDVNTDVADMSKAKQPGWFPRQIKAWLRDREKKYERQLVTLFLTSQETVKIGTGGGMYAPPEKTSVAGDAIKFFASIAIDMSIKDWKDRSGVKIGREMMLKTFKSKISGAYGHKVSFFLTDDNGFDFIHSDAEFLLGKDSPFADGRGIFRGERLCYRHANGITCRPLGDRSFRTEEEFVRAFYDNRDVLDTCRDGLRIWGYGLPHEVKYHGQYDDDGRWIGSGAPPAMAGDGRDEEDNDNDNDNDNEVLETYGSDEEPEPSGE